MKATDLLRRDHRTARSLFARWERAGTDTARRALVFEELRHHLRVHALVEEELFYPALRQSGTEESRDLIHEALAEHKIVEELLNEIAALNPEHAEYAAKVRFLRENVEHHAEEEEEELFREARRYLSAESLRRLAVEMEELKKSLAAGWRA